MTDWHKTTVPETPGESTANSVDRSDDRDKYKERLRGLLPSLRHVDGFPIGKDEDILAMSNPPHYTACPNPFVEEFVRRYGTAYDERGDDYHRTPLAVDVSEGKTGALYGAHGYHTKVPPKAIVRSILHYTEPGDIVLDGFAGSGMVGVAGQLCGAPDPALRQELEHEWQVAWQRSPAWGLRRSVLNDLGPAATFIAANYNIPFDIERFTHEGNRILNELRDEVGWMYQTAHVDGTIGVVNYTVWSEVFGCPNCSEDIVFLDAALDRQTFKVRDAFACPHCGVVLNKDRLERRFETRSDPATGDLWRRIQLQPVIINYSVEGATFEKAVDSTDLMLWKQIETLPLPGSMPTYRFPIDKMSHGSRLAPKGFTHVHQLFLPRAAQSLGMLWTKAQAVADERIRHALLFFVEQAIWGMSVLNRYQPIQYGKPGGSQVNRQQSGVYYVASQTAEVSPWYILDGKLDRLYRAFMPDWQEPTSTIVTTGTAAQLDVPDASIDYIFTDPPFGENIPYADLNYFVESWHRVWTNAAPEAIIDRTKGKELADYQRLMEACFAEYHRVLKPGRWMTVVFHNSKNSVWNAIQEALQRAGFIVADVRTLDKQQRSFRQITSTAVKQDMVISVYKPRHRFIEQFDRGAGTELGAWEFARQHLRQLPVFVETNGQAELIADRDPEILYNRMIAFHLMRGATIPLSKSEFVAGLHQRFLFRDGMFFLPEQAAEYDLKRLTVDAVEQLSLFVSDEGSAIQWLRQLLNERPRTYQEIHPEFLKQLNQARHERLPELSHILDQNFLKDSAERWYVPDPHKQADLERLRERELLAVFSGYAASKGKLREFRSEAVRAGFKECWRDRDYRTIVEVAERLPSSVLQEDAQLLMYYDNASAHVH